MFANSLQSPRDARSGWREQQGQRPPVGICWASSKTKGKQAEWLELKEQEEGDRKGIQMQAGPGPWSLQAKGPVWAQSD